MKMRTRTLALAAAAAAIITIATGCSSPTAGNGAPAGDNSYLETAKANTEKYIAGTDRALPTEAPDPEAGKTVWVIACAMAAEGCATPANAAAEAGETIGWNMTVQDGKLDPNTYNQLIRGAIAANVDGIILQSVDCGPVAEAVNQATAAGIAVVGSVALDCNQQYIGGEPGFSAQVSYCADPTDDPATLETCFEEFIKNEYAANMADYAISKFDGAAEVIVMQEDDTLHARLVGEGVQAQMSKCGGCTVHVVEFTGQDLVSGNLQTKAAAALVKYPNANAVVIPYDAAGFLGVSAAVQSAQAQGRSLELIGAEGLSGAIEQIKSGEGQTFASGAPSAWWGWAAVDTMIRAFAGEPQVDQGIGVQAIDKDNNLPTETPYYDGNQDTDWRGNYLEIWGVS